MKKDYYSVLVRALSDIDPTDSEARRSVYERARFAMARAPLTIGEIRQERSSLEAAIRKIEAEVAGTDRILLPRERIVDRPPDEIGDGPIRVPAALAEPTRRPSHLLVAGLAVMALLVSGFAGYEYWRKTTAETIRILDRASVQEINRVPSRGAPDEKTRSYMFNRQMVYYRSTHPAGTIVITKSQNFLYLVRPNTAALRYTIGVGQECSNVAGLLLVSAKEDWSGGSAERPMSESRSTAPAADGRFGARSLTLSDTGYRIHGSQEPVAGRVIGCFPLVNEDVIDLYERVALGTRVVMN